MQRLARLKVATLILALLAGTADAGINLRRPSGPMPAEASQMIEGEIQLAPIAYLQFCINYSSQCQLDDKGERIELTQATWTLLNEVNAQVNSRIAPDPHKGGFDWSLDATLGNCNDYAVQKRKSLMERGFSSSALSLSVVITPWGDGHLVLAVRTDRGDYVLDNIRPTIVSWDRTGYKFNRVQALGRPHIWVRPRMSKQTVWSAPLVDRSQFQVIGARAEASDLNRGRRSPEMNGYASQSHIRVDKTTSPKT